MPEAKQLLGIDLGTKRTGIARASSLARIAEPLTSVTTDDLLEALKRISAQEPTEKVVVGLPRNLEGTDTSQTDWVRHWLEAAKSALPQLQFFLQDEALTSVEAQARAGKNLTDVDAAAAAIILQDFLDGEDDARI